MKIRVNYNKILFLYLLVNNSINMDSFDYESLERYIGNFKRNVINKIESIHLLEKDLKNQSDLLCMVLDYSPKICYDKKSMKRVNLKPSSLLIDGSDKKEIKSFILERQTIHEENSPNESDKEHTIKLSRLSSKIQKDDFVQLINNDDKNNKNFMINKYLLTLFIKEIINEIISKALIIVFRHYYNNLEMNISCKTIFFSNYYDFLNIYIYLYIYQASDLSSFNSKENKIEKNDENEETKIEFDIPIESQREKNILTENLKTLEENNIKNLDNNNIIEGNYSENLNIHKSHFSKKDNNYENNKGKKNDYVDPFYKEEEDEYCFQIHEISKILEEKRRHKYIDSENNSISYQSRFTNKLNKKHNIKIFIYMINLKRF